MRSRKKGCPEVCTHGSLCEIFVLELKLAPRRRRGFAPRSHYDCAAAFEYFCAKKKNWKIRNVKRRKLQRVFRCRGWSLSGARKAHSIITMLWLSLATGNSGQSDNNQQ